MTALHPKKFSDEGRSQEACKNMENRLIYNCAIFFVILYTGLAKSMSV